MVIKLGKAIGIGSTTPSVTSISNSGTFSWEKTKEKLGKEGLG